MLKRIKRVMLVAVLASLPVALFFASRLDAPAWYIFLSAVTQALGMGLIAAFFGVVVLIARRGSEGGGVKGAVVTTLIVSLITSQAMLYPLLRG